MRKYLVATVALLVGVAKSVSLDNDVDQSKSKMLLQHVKRDTDTCQGLGDDCKNHDTHTFCRNAANKTTCRQQDCCEGLVCKPTGDSKKELLKKIGVCKKNYLDYDNRCTTKAGDSCVKRVTCRARFPTPCTITCCKGLTCSSNVCKWKWWALKRMKHPFMPMANRQEQPMSNQTFSDLPIFFWNPKSKCKNISYAIAIHRVCYPYLR